MQGWASMWTDLLKDNDISYMHDVCGRMFLQLLLNNYIIPRGILVHCPSFHMCPLTAYPPHIDAHYTWCKCCLISVFTIKLVDISGRMSRMNRVILICAGSCCLRGMVHERFQSIKKPVMQVLRRFKSIAGRYGVWLPINFRHFSGINDEGPK